jgi:tetratricopeptide (TPR) repeat protein
MAASARRSNRPRSADFTTPLTIPGGAVAGADVVRELAPEVALPVWQTLRTVLTWAGEEPALRGDLFEPCAMADWERQLLLETWEPDVRSPLAVLVGELATPAKASPETVAHACLCVTDWALERGHVATGLAFAEAAALSWPQHPRYSWMAGRLLRSHGRPREAELWLRRAEKAASTAGDWEARTLALNSLGNAYYEAGDYRRAAATQRQALRAARKHRLKQREGEVLHDLYVATWYMGATTEAEEYARAALDIYRSGHDRLPALAHDVAFSWLAQGHYGRALRILRELQGYFADPHERIRVLASTARAAGGSGESGVFSEAANEIWSLAEQPGAAPGVAAALVELARGASSLEQWDLAERSLAKALAVALARAEADVQELAGQALEAIRAQRAAAPDRSQLDIVPFARLDALANGFVSSLRTVRRVAA